MGGARPPANAIMRPSPDPRLFIPTLRLEETPSSKANARQGTTKMMRVLVAWATQTRHHVRRRDKVGWLWTVVKLFEKLLQVRTRYWMEVGRSSLDDKLNFVHVKNVGTSITYTYLVS